MEYDYAIPQEPDGPVQSVYGSTIYNYWPEREQWVSEDGLNAFHWDDLVRDAGPLKDYQPTYMIEVDGDDNAWPFKGTHEEVSKKLEGYARGLDLSVIKCYDRGVKLITDHSKYIIKESK